MHFLGFCCFTYRLISEPMYVGFNNLGTLSDEMIDWLETTISNLELLCKSLPMIQA